ncbi:MAG TPA: glycoside hydrolase family 88 protein [Dinghuibacter sp.]|uniref:glycoside hydrolase family 88 protein n=1 Tax=Dinghuibacter sp. TaxID=2024697 RepID=UPI002BF115F3|nr:glycoside hydrolase family 88 protein [Dinghuibacter sp.]HTJ14021.1 glycoside hydrolase family 88 protein [Dinghuibacter sp.]
MKHIHTTLALFLILHTHAQTLVWSDEFNYHGRPDSTRWTYEQGFVRNQEPQRYTTDNAIVDSGMLIIEARKTPEGYTSASLTTQGKASWQYGRIEIRAKVPAAAGSWPAFWMLGDDRGKVKWPLCGEIDIMEFLGKDPLTVYGTSHYADSTDAYRHQGGTYTATESPANGFHVYALDWYPDHMDWYYDNQKYFTFDVKKSTRGVGKGNIYQKPFYLLLNLALGHEGSWAGPVKDSAFPMRYYIDYVRVYQNDPTLTAMKRVADWQLNNKAKYPAWDWVNAVGYTGISALARIDTTYYRPLLKIGEALSWNTGPTRQMADDYCIGQTYAQLYERYGQKEMMQRFQALADSIQNRPHKEPLEWKNKIQLREWAWCDALYMGPPGLAILAKATNEKKYLDLADSLWWKTTDYLYSKKDSLYYRDSRYFGQREPNGQPMFWSRGNGWVMAGLARMLDNMPLRYKDRKKYESLYKAMAHKIASLQQPDGSWHASLLDPESYKTKETSGTALFCYAFAWGINHHILSREYKPTAERAWQALVEAIQPDGRLGYVQQIGENPQNTTENSTEAYGTGAFLLAGSEMRKLQ